MDVDGQVIVMKKPKDKPTGGQWRSRIVGRADVPPSSLIAHDLNWRLHPESQAKALDQNIDEIGFIRSVTVNQRTGKVLDGHLRLERALATKQKTIPVEYVDLSVEEERKALLTIDPLAGLATADTSKLEALMNETNWKEIAGIPETNKQLKCVMDDLAADWGSMTDKAKEKATDYPGKGDPPEIHGLKDGVQFDGVGYFGFPGIRNDRRYEGPVPCHWSTSRKTEDPPPYLIMCPWWKRTVWS